MSPQHEAHSELKQNIREYPLIYGILFEKHSFLMPEVLCSTTGDHLWTAHISIMYLIGNSLQFPNNCVIMEITDFW